MADANKELQWQDIEEQIDVKRIQCPDMTEPDWDTRDCPDLG